MKRIDIQFYKNKKKIASIDFFGLYIDFRKLYIIKFIDRYDPLYSMNLNIFWYSKEDIEDEFKNGFDSLKEYKRISFWKVFKTNNYNFLKWCVLTLPGFIIGIIIGTLINYYFFFPYLNKL